MSHPLADAEVNTAPLGLVAEVTLGKMIQSSPVEGAELVPYIKAKNVRPEKVEVDSLGSMYATPAERVALAVRMGDIFVIEGGATAGRAAVVRDSPPEECIFQNAVHRVRAGPRMEQRFLYYVLAAYPQTGWYEAICSAATFKHLTGEKMARLPVPVPPLEVQRRIADMLDTETARIDVLIEKNDQVVGLLAARAARILEDEIFSASARPVGIHYLAKYVNGFPFKPDDRSDEGTPIVRIAQLLGDAREQDFYAGKPDAYCHIDSGDLIFSWSATLAAKVWEGGPAFLNQHLFKVEPHEHVDRDWLLHALNASVPRMKALTHGSTMTHITRPMMTKIRVPNPSLPEQRIISERIAVRFGQLDALRAKIRRQQELLRLRRQSLISAAVTGQIEV